MRTRLIVMRHAKSSLSDAGLDDHDRPLNRRGRREAPRIAQELHDREWIPDRIRVSTSKRTMETLELMEAISRKSTIDVEPSLYHSNISALLQAVKEVEEGKTTMILSHNPGSEILVHQLSNRLEVIPTAAAALFEEKHKGWTLVDVLRPKELITQS
ncbi:MAG: 2,3-bisphosphoglycerate-dependent phosphoglycerate mutase [Candidatus Poseidoniaceae archaeon]|nr:MAG: 2,3-bisphosphoglycerate-dependent phosphoglycerate mutase [Candidatus Poseidoniaceae archaeon]